MLSRKMTSLTNKSADWTPNYHKTGRKFPQIPWSLESITKLSLNKPAIITVTDPTPCTRTTPGELPVDPEIAEL